MAVYTGAGSFPAWMTLANSGGVSGAGAQSENIPVAAGVNYQFNVVCSFASTWASGVQLQVTFYDVGGNVLTNSTVTQANMTGGVLYQVNTGFLTAPASSSFAIASIIIQGSPAASNLLNVFQAEVQDASFRQCNVNFTFTYTFWPWSVVLGSETLTWAFSPLLAGDSDSLVLDGIIELMGGIQGVQCDVPELLDSNGQGPTFRILAPPSLNSSGLGYEQSYDMSAPQPTQDVVASMLLDGERPFGDRSSNRTIHLPIVIFGTMAGGMAQVLKAREYLMSLIDQQSFPLKWTSADSGLPMIFDCFRALPTLPVYGFNYDAGGTATGSTIGRPNYPIAALTLEIQALPFGRSDIDGVQNLAFASPISGGINPQTVAPSTLDTFGTVFSAPPIINSPTWANHSVVTPTGVSSFTANFSAGVAAGSTVVVQVNSASANITGVTDTQGNVYTQASVSSTGGACFNSVFTAPVANPLTAADHVTVTASGAGNFLASLLSVTGAWTASVALSTTGTGSSFSTTFNANQYTMLVSCVFGLGGAGVTPANYTAITSHAANGFAVNLGWYSQPINQATTPFSVASGLPNPWGIQVLAFTPVNQYWNLDTTTQPPAFVGHSAHYTPPRPFNIPYPAATYQQTLRTSVNIVGCPVMSVNFGQAYDTQWPKDPKFISNCVFHWTITDNVGRTLSFSKSQKNIPYGAHTSTPKWTQVNAPIPQGKSFNYNAVTAYSVRVTNWQASGKTGYVRLHCWLNDVVANPQTIQNSVSARGALYNLYSLAGSARSPVSVQCQLPAAQTISKEITTPATGSWIVPPGVYSVQAETWAGGGAGAAASLSRPLAGGGGGGAEYAQEPALPVVPGQRVPWSIGAGGTPGQLAPTVVQYTHAGLGHWTCPPNVTSILAETWGGGGAGGAGAGGAGGAEYANVHVPVTPGVTYNVFTGAGGKADTGTSKAQILARQGGDSWFGPPGNLQRASGYVAAYGGLTSLTGSTSGAPGGKVSPAGAANPATQLKQVGHATPASGTSYNVPLNDGGKAIPAGDAAILVVTTPAVSTIGLTDTSGNTWVHLGSSVSNINSNTGVFACFNVKALNAKSTVKVTQTVNQGSVAVLYDAPFIIGTDSTVTTNTGAGGTPTITSTATTYPGELVLTVFANASANTNSTPAGWTALGANSGNGVFSNLFAIQNPSASTETATTSYGQFVNWAAVAVTFLTQVHYGGGRGGTSPGPSGGGGGGAGGATGWGSNGGNSQPFVTNSGTWQQGGAGGAGNGAGGAGGAGANTPGFPVAGAQPGGGGGGGYQTQPLFNPANPSNALPGQQQTNFLGADGGTGMVQLTYQVGSGTPVNGGNTTFGSVALTGTIVTAHGGTSALNNSAVGGLGGTGSSNTIHGNGGSGGLNTGGAQGSYFASPSVTNLFTTLGNAAWNATGTTTSAAAASVAQGVAVAIIASTAQVTDLQVTDSAGNAYVVQGIQQAQGSSGVTLYAYVADIEFPISSGSTTLTVSSASSQQYGLLWYASPWLATGVTSGNSGTGNGTSAAFSGQFGVADTKTLQLELGIVLSDTSRTVSSLTQTSTWFNASTTNSQAAGTMSMAAYVMANGGGGTGSAGTGDIFSGSLSGSGNWAVLCVPLAYMNQQDQVFRIDQRGGVTPGTQTSWATEAAIQANGTLVVLGQSGTGVTASPTAVTDQGGNVYTSRMTASVTGGGNYSMWAFTAPVTAALAAGATGAVKWGSASAAPNYWQATYWIPNASAWDAAATAQAGTGTTATNTITPGNPNDLVIGFNGVATTAAETFGVTGSPAWNAIDTGLQSYLKGSVWAAQVTDEAATPVTATFSTSAPWGFQLLSFRQALTGTGGGAAGGANGAGYPGVWQFGAPGYVGGGKGGQGGGATPQAGYGASYPGGGGGGCLAVSGSPQEGGQGAPGAVRLTWTPPLQTFNTLIVHSLGSNADPNVNPCVPIPITDTPNNTEYAVPSVNGLMNATFNSTYTVMLANFFWNSSTSSTPRQITVTVNQYEYPGGPKYSVQVSKGVIPATDSVNGLLSMGEVTLPVKDYLKYNDQSYFTVSINDTDSSDRFMDVLLLDTLGQTAVINVDPGHPGYGQYQNYFIDEAASDRDLGFVGASVQDRQHQVSVLDCAQLTGPGLNIGAGDNLFFVYSPAGAPSLAVQYAPRWYLDRSV